MRVGVVTGLDFEAAVIRANARVAGVADRVFVLAGLGPARARQAAEAMLADGAQALLSFGVAGGLDVSAACGSVIVARAITAPGRPAISCSAPWTARLQAALQACPVLHGDLAHTDEILANPDAKAELQAATGALAADMESYDVGETALAAGAPFAALRVVADTAGEHLPPIALHSMAPDGSLKLAETLRRIAQSPAQIPALIRLARSTSRARHILSTLSEIAAPEIFFADVPGVRTT